MAIRTPGIKRTHVIKAAKKWREQPGYGGFHDSIHYDVVIGGEHFPPKAIAAIANELAGERLLHPSEFAGAKEGKWHKKLTDLEFDIVPKGVVRTDPDELGPSARLDKDIKEIVTEYGNDPTTRETLVMARLGQGKYRKDLLDQWENKCAVTGCDVTHVIRASHAKPWRDSTNDERLNPNNGLPLVANLDALFDAGLISFDTRGSILVSTALQKGSGLLDGMPSGLRKAPTPEQAAFLEHHAERVFQQYASIDLLF